MRKEKKIKVGQILFDGQLRKYEVVRAGHVYFYVKRENAKYPSSDKYSIQTMICVSEFGGGHKLFASEQEALDELERNHLINKISAFFRPVLWHKDMALDNLRAVAEATNIAQFKKPIDQKELANRVYAFLEKYASIKPEYDSEDEKYTSSDATMLKMCADMLMEGKTPTRLWSEWGSGGYKPYSSKNGQKEHDFLVAEITKIIRAREI